jgi:hypothetical protein
MRHDRGGWDVEFYADEQGREPCREWADGLSAIKTAALTAGVEVGLAKLGTNVAATELARHSAAGSTS